MTKKAPTRRLFLDEELLFFGQFQNLFSSNFASGPIGLHDTCNLVEAFQLGAAPKARNEQLFKLTRQRTRTHKLVEVFRDDRFVRDDVRQRCTPDFDALREKGTSQPIRLVRQDCGYPGERQLQRYGT